MSAERPRGVGGIASNAKTSIIAVVSADYQEKQETMPAGRPSKLTPKIIEQAKEYVQGGYASVGDKIPSQVGLAIVLDVRTQTLYNWADKNKQFLDILEKCNEAQRNVLINNGLSGEFNATICKLVLGKHGYHERQEHSGPDGGPIETKSKVLPMTGVLPDGKKVGNTE